MPSGPMLPRKDSGHKNFKMALSISAYQVGVLVAIERNRKGWTQEQLAEKVGVDQAEISDLENGKRFPYDDATVDDLFTKLELPDDERASFVKWWRDNS